MFIKTRWTCSLGTYILFSSARKYASSNVAGYQLYTQLPLGSSNPGCHISCTRTFQQEIGSPKWSISFIRVFKNQALQRVSPHDRCRRTVKDEAFCSWNLWKITWCSSKKWWILTLGPYILYSSVRNCVSSHVKGQTVYIYVIGVATLDVWSPEAHN